jgi:hypothetical protein
MLGRPPLLRQDERPALLRRPDEHRIDMLARLLAATPVGTTTTPLSGQRHPVATARLRARDGTERPPEGKGRVSRSGATGGRDPAHATRYTYLDHRSPSVVRARGVGTPPGRFYLRARSLAERAMGTKQRRHEGSARALSGERFSPKATPGGWPESFKGFRPSFRSLPCADDCRCFTAALRALPYRSIARVKNSKVVMLCLSTVKTFLTAARVHVGFCCFLTLSTSAGDRIAPLGNPPLRPVPHPTEFSSVVMELRRENVSVLYLIVLAIW